MSKVYWAVRWGAVVRICWTKTADFKEVCLDCYGMVSDNMEVLSLGTIKAQARRKYDATKFRYVNPDHMDEVGPPDLPDQVHAGYADTDYNSMYMRRSLRGDVIHITFAGYLDVWTLRDGRWTRETRRDKA